MEAKEKWKRGFSKLRKQLSRKESTISIISQQSSVMDEDDISESEVEQYLTKLKSKTGLKGLWSGNKFDGFVDGDRTPDISTDSDDELNKKFSMNADQLRQLRLDSDEDELRIDYMRTLKSIDENNNELDVDSGSDSDKPLNLMNNIHFAELEIGKFELSDNESKVEKVSDFLPQVYTLDPDTDEKTDSESDFSGGNLRKNIHMLDEISEEHTSQNLSKHTTALSKSVSSVHTEKEDEISEQSISHAHSRNTNSKQNKYSSSNFESVESSPRKSRSSPRKIKSKISTRNSDNSFRSSSRSKTRTSDDSFSESTLKSTSTILTDSSRSYHKKRTKRSKKHSTKQSPDNRHSEKRKHHSTRTRSSSPHKHAQTQTKYNQHDDLTDEVLNFRYTWKSPSANNLANHVVDVAAMDILTNYNPAVLAANDMLKFHLDLLQRHISDSQRLYDAYAKQGLNTNYKYTSYEDTLKYIKKNTPNVISFEDALKEIKEKENDS